jgi:hypothetical protein
VLHHLCSTLEDLAHRRGLCLVDPPAWTYRLTIGEYADYTIKPLCPANLWWRFGQWTLRKAEPT